MATKKATRLALNLTKNQIKAIIQLGRGDHSLIGVKHGVVRSLVIKALIAPTGFGYTLTGKGFATLHLLNEKEEVGAPSLGLIS